MKQVKGSVAKKNGLPVRSNIKAGDFWDDMRSMYSSAYNKVAGLASGGSSAASGGAGNAAASGAGPAGN